MRRFLLAAVFVSTCVCAEEDHWCEKVHRYHDNVVKIDFDQESAKQICDFCSGADALKLEFCSMISCIDGGIWVIGESNVEYMTGYCQERAQTQITTQTKQASFWDAFRHWTPPHHVW